MSVLRPCLAGCFYWLDLTGPDGRPAATKILAFLTQLVLLTVLTIFAVRLQDVTTSFVLLTLVCGALPYGLDGLKTLLKLKFGGLDVAVTEQERQRPAALRAEAELVAARRDEALGLEPAP